MIPWHKGELLQWNLVGVHHFFIKNDGVQTRYIHIVMTKTKWTGELIAISETDKDSQETWDNLAKKAKALTSIWKCPN